MNEVVIGKRYGYLTVLAPKETGKTRKSYLCQCDCGKKIVLGRVHILGNKKRNPNKSCGCMQKRQNRNSLLHRRLYGMPCLTGVTEKEMPVFISMARKA